jgi:hypothetical protein
MKYLNQSRKRIKLPSGAEIVIHKLNSFAEPFISTEKDETQRGYALSRFILTQRVGKLCFEGEESTIVDIPAKAAVEGTLPIEALDQSDADEIIKQVLSFSGLDKAGQEARKTFPEKPEASSRPASNGEAIRVPSDNPAPVANG